MKSRQDTSTFTNEKFSEFANLITNLIEKESRCNAYIAKVKSDRHGNVPCITFGGSSANIIIELGLCEGINEVPEFIQKLINERAALFFKRNNFNSSVTIKGQAVTSVYDLSQQNLVRLLVNLKPYGAPSFAEFNEANKGKGIREKIKFLQPFIAKAIFTKAYTDQFPNTKETPEELLKSSALTLSFANVLKKIKQINDKSAEITTLLAYQIKKFTQVEMGTNSKGQKNITFDYKLIVDAIAKSDDSLIKKWSTCVTLKNFLEDQEKNFKQLTEEAAIELNKVAQLVKSIETLWAILDKIPQSEYLKILDSDAIFKKLPPAENLREVLNFCKDVHKVCADNWGCHEQEIALFEQLIGTSSAELLQELDDMMTTFVEVASPPLVQNNQPSSPQNDPNPHAFFSPESEMPAKSLTATVKEEAKEKLATKKIKTTSQTANKNIPSIESTNLSVKNKEKVIYFHSDKNPGHPIAAKAFLLPGISHVYFCCDASHMKNIQAKVLEEFQKIAERGKILARNSEGLEGIKMYGLNFLYLKSLSKSIAANRMLCIAHPIEGTNFYVYRFEQLLSHEECDKLVLDKSGKIERIASRARESITASFNTEESTLNHKASLK